MLQHMTASAVASVFTVDISLSEYQHMYICQHVHAIVYRQYHPTQLSMQLYGHAFVSCNPV